jgi:hypothetical protein
VVVKLINTDGMALIGPGSEWFWTAVTGVVLAVTFLAIYRQLRAQQMQAADNTRLLRSQAHYNALMLDQRPWEMVIENRDLASIMTIGSATPEALSEADWVRCWSHMFLQFNAWEYLYYQHRDGSIPKEMWVGSDAFFGQQVATRPGLTRFWSENQTSFDEPFRSHVEEVFTRTVVAAAATQG